jgi:hypothetical protein
MSQAIPPTSRATPATTGFATNATATVVAAITTDDAETRRLSDALRLKRGRSVAPPTAPAPKQPSRIP